MSTVDDLKIKLLNLECHFTWDLREEDFSLEDLVNRLDEQIKLESEEARVTRAYSSLAFVSHLYGDRYAALTNLHKSEELAKKYYGVDSDKFLIVTYGDLAWLYYHMEHFALVEDYLKLLDQICMKLSSDEVRSEVLREKGWAFLKFCRRYYNGARECFRQALDIKPEDSDLNAGYAIALYRTTTDPTDSQDSPTVAQLRRAINLNPKDAVLFLFLAIRLLSINKNPTSPKSAIHDPSQLMKQSGEAISLVVRALEMSPENPHVSRYVAQFSRKLGSVDFAIQQLEETLTFIPDSAFIHHQLALCYKQKKISLKKKYGSCQKVDNYEEQEYLHKCIHHLERAVSLKPGFICAMAELAVQYGQIRDISKAERLFEEAFQLSKEKEDLQTVHARYGQFQLYSKGSEILAIYNYMEGLKLQTDTLQGMKCETELKQIVHHRFSNNPNDSKAWAIDGFIHELKGENIKAAECYEKALTNDTGIGESPLLAEVRIWLLGFKDAEKSARNVILGCHTHNEEALGTGRPTIVKGKMANKFVHMIEIDLCSSKKNFTREKSILAPGPHAVLLAFHHDKEVTEDIKHALEDLQIFGQSFWKHVFVVFTNEETCIRGQESVLQWLLEKCGYRYYIAGTAPEITQTMELSDRIMNMISRNNTMHLIIPAIASTSSLCKMVKESERERRVLTPENTTEMGERKYRLLFKYAGWFYCASTKLGFKMNGEGEVLYGTVDQDSSCPVSTNHYAAGPLYDIKCVRGELSQLQLPHCEISPENDCNFLTVAHYTGHSVEVLKPENITHTHVTVNVPGTSWFRFEDIWNVFKREIRGQIILVYHPVSPRHWLYVFLRSLNGDAEKLCENDGRPIPGPCECNLEHASHYSIYCEDTEDPQRKPKIQQSDGLFLRDKWTNYPTFAIQLKDNTMNVKLRLRQQGKAEDVWAYDLPSLREYQSISVKTMNEEQCKSFVEDNFADLIQSGTNVDPILDKLVGSIHSETISTIRSEPTDEKKMRELLILVVKETLPPVKFYKSLQDVYPELVKKFTHHGANY